MNKVNNIFERFIVKLLSPSKEDVMSCFNQELIDTVFNNLGNVEFEDLDWYNLGENSIRYVVENNVYANRLVTD